MKHLRVVGALVLLFASLSEAFNVNVGRSRSFQESIQMNNLRNFHQIIFQQYRFQNLEQEQDFFGVLHIKATV